MQTFYIGFLNSGQSLALVEITLRNYLGHLLKINLSAAGLIIRLISSWQLSKRAFSMVDPYFGYSRSETVSKVYKPRMGLHLLTCHQCFTKCPIVTIGPYVIPVIFHFYISIKTYNTNLLVTLHTEYLTTLRGRCHWVQNAMTTPWHHKKQKRLTYELQKENK